MRSVETVADRVAMLNEGSILVEGTLESLKQSDDPLVKKFIQDCREVR